MPVRVRAHPRRLSNGRLTQIREHLRALKAEAEARLAALQEAQHYEFPEWYLEELSHRFHVAEKDFIDYKLNAREEAAARGKPDPWPSRGGSHEPPTGGAEPAPAPEPSDEPEVEPAPSDRAPVRRSHHSKAEQAARAAHRQERALRGEEAE